MTAKKEIKKVNDHQVKTELAELNKVAVFVIELSEILKRLGCETISEFELKINEKSGFVNAQMSATAFGFDKEYSRLLELEKLIDSRLSVDDLTPSKQLKPSVLKALTDKHTEYFSSRDLEVKKVITEIFKLHSSLDIDEKKNIGYNRNGDLVYSPFSPFRG